MKIESKKQAEEFLASARKDISEVENWLKNHESSNEEEMEKLFLELANNLRIEINENENRYYNSKNDIIFIQDKKNKKIWFSYDRFWKFFYDEFSLNYNEIQAFTKAMMEKHYDLKEYTTPSELRPNPVTMEKHYDLKEYTTNTPAIVVNPEAGETL